MEAHEITDDHQTIHEKEIPRLRETEGKKMCTDSKRSNYQEQHSTTRFSTKYHEYETNI